MTTFFTQDVFYAIFLATLRMAVPLALVTLGATFSVLCGVSELGCEGMMIAGAFFGVLASYLSGSRWLGVFFAMLAGIVFALVHGLMHVVYKVNHTISGMAVNLLASAFAPLLVKLVWNTNSITPTVDSFKTYEHTALKRIPGLSFLSEMNIFFFAVLLLVCISWFYFFKTKRGFRMRSVGENPQAANTLGINVIGYKLAGVAICGALSGLGGASLSLGQLSQYVDGMTAGRGYIAMVINAFGHYRPLGSLLGALFFGFFDALQLVLQSSAIPSQFLMMLPYVVTLLIVSFGLKRIKQPAGVGKHHDN